MSTVRPGFKYTIFPTKNWPYKWDDPTSERIYYYFAHAVDSKIDPLTGMAL